MTPYEENEVLKLEQKNQELRQRLERQENDFRQLLDLRFEQEFEKQRKSSGNVSKRVFFITVATFAILVGLAIFLVSTIAAKRQADLASQFADKSKALQDSLHKCVQYGDYTVFQSRNIPNCYIRHRKGWLQIEARDYAPDAWEGDTQFKIKRSGDYQ